MVQVSVIIPTMNEEASIGRVLDDVHRALEPTPYDHELLVVDTRSVDRTVEIAEARGARVVQEDRRGYGRAYKTGFAAAQGAFLVTLDADATYPAEAIPRFLRRLEAGWDFVSGDRMTRLDREAMEPHHRLGNAVLNWTVRLLYGVPIRDSQSGMWVFRRAILDRLDLENDGMPFSEEIKLEVLAAGFRFLELPIDYRPRLGEVKLRSWEDGWANLRYLVRRRLSDSVRDPGAPPPGPGGRRG